ncbi:MAG: PAS domain S-box protein [Dehalococcoidia bacterium]|nr:PAS domain S-box protein [Dehalococcoidia bacterium]
MLVDDASDDPGLPAGLLRQEKLQAELIVPLRAKGAITGTLCVANRRPRAFLPEEVELLTAIGAQIGIALENTNLYRQEQMMAVQYRSIFDNTTEAIWLHNLSGDILKVNRAVTKLTGYDTDELTRMNIAQFLPEEGLAIVRETQRKLLRSEVQAGEPYDQRVIRKDRSEVLVRVGSSPIYENGQLVGFQQIATDVTKERLMQENLRFYIEAVTKAQEEERKRIARELHDETAQQLIALSRQLDDFSNHSKRLSAEDVEVLNTWRQRLKDALQGVRLFSRDLRPPMIDDLGLIPALEWLTGQISSESSMEVDLRVAGVQRRLTPETELLLFRIVQEALNNARRHAQASAVEVSVEFDQGAVNVMIKDNGKGFRLPESVADLSRSGRLGLMGMEERARLLGADLSIKSEPGHGTTIRVKTPV